MSVRDANGVDLEPYLTAIREAIGKHPRKAELEILWTDLRLDMLKLGIERYAESHPGKEFQWSEESIQQLLDNDLLVVQALIGGDHHFESGTVGIREISDEDLFQT